MTTTTTTKNKILRTIVTVPENERALVMRNGRFVDILLPGRHVLSRLRGRIDVESFDIGQFFNPKAAAALIAARPGLMARHLTEVRTGANEVAVIYRDGLPFWGQMPNRVARLWTDAGPWTVERVDVLAELDALPVLRKVATQQTAAVRLTTEALGLDKAVHRVEVAQSQQGILYVDNAFARVLGAGSYAFWSIGRTIAVKIVDLRLNAIDVPGQEILTRDRVSIRVNIAAAYRVADPVKAVDGAKDFADVLYRALQHAFRQSLGSKTLDAILADKVAVDAEAADVVRQQMAAIGVEVTDIAVKDVILPGEIRAILNRVVEAQKEAEANVIRRREETNATRSLLNTARVMEENPVMLRLKELEALETIAGKVQNLVVHNGTQGLLEGVASLRPAISGPTG
ncbi:MAG: SPFH domain-containing protein [Alphaproteobacteria bacterium]